MNHSLIEEMEQQSEQSFTPYKRLECRESLVEVSNFLALDSDNID